MTVKLTIEVPDAEFAAILADAIGGANHERAVGALAEAGMTPDTRQGSPRATEADPWADPPADAPASQPAATQASTAARPHTVTVNNPKGKQQWTIGADRAPDCLCGQPAAYVVGSTNGKTWKRWTCAEGVGENWRNKCDFSEWVR